MVKLNAGNVLLKPSHRRQMMTWLKRTQKLGGQIGDFFLTINLYRTGRLTEVRAEVRDAAGNFSFKVRRPEWRDALQEIARMLVVQLNAQRLGLAGF
jgi:hypothetical protein